MVLPYPEGSTPVRGMTGRWCHTVTVDNQAVRIDVSCFRGEVVWLTREQADGSPALAHST